MQHIPIDSLPNDDPSFLVPIAGIVLLLLVGWWLLEAAGRVAPPDNPDEVLPAPAAPDKIEGWEALDLENLMQVEGTWVWDRSRRDPEVARRILLHQRGAIYELPRTDFNDGGGTDHEHL